MLFLLRSDYCCTLFPPTLVTELLSVVNSNVALIVVARIGLVESCEYATSICNLINVSQLFLNLICRASLLRLLECLCNKWVHVMHV